MAAAFSFILEKHKAAQEFKEGEKARKKGLERIH